MNTTTKTVSASTAAALQASVPSVAALLLGALKKETTPAPAAKKGSAKTRADGRKVSMSSKTAGIDAADMIAATNYAADLTKAVGPVNAIRQFTVANPLMERKDVLAIFIGIGLNAGTVGRQYQEARQYGVEGNK